MTFETPNLFFKAIYHAFKVKSPKCLIPAYSLGVKHAGLNKGVGWHQTQIQLCEKTQIERV